MFAIDYRLSTATQVAWPQALLDCKAALQYLRGNAAALGVDPERIGVGGDSAGGGLAALVGVTQDLPAFANRYPQDAYSSASTKVKVAVPIYGVYDMMAWQKYTSGQTNNTKPLEQFFGGTPSQLPGLYFESSPISYLREAATNLGGVAMPNADRKYRGLHRGGWSTRRAAGGTIDPVCSGPSRCRSTVTTVPVPNIDHYWFTASALTGKQGIPVCEETTAAHFVCSGPTPNDFITSQLLDFLAHNL